MGSKLYTQCAIGSLILKNRIMMPALNLNFCTSDGFVTDKLVSFYKARSLGGVGLIVAGAAGIDPEYLSTTGVIQISHDKYLSGLRRLTGEVHTNSGRIFIQLWHPGAYGKSSEHSGAQSVAPSAVLSNFTHDTPRELSIPEVHRHIRLFAEAAGRAKEAGFDGIELAGNAGYLISQFLSPKTNKRTDKYGGETIAERMTFLREVVLEVQRVAGKDFPLMVRLAGNEFIPGGNGSVECVFVAKQLEALGVHALSITGGWHETSVPQLTMDVPRGAFVYLAQAVKMAVGIPVAACNRLDALTAERVVNSGAADIAAIGRGNVADPCLAAKAAAGSYDLIRPCVGCNQQCMDNIFSGRQLSCLINVDVALEYNPGSRTDSVLVVGAGPAGMEYARVSASMGAKVTVWEKQSVYGGTLAIAAAPPGRQELWKLAEYLNNSCVELGVEFVFNKEAGADSIKDALDTGFDHVVLAIGGIESQPEFKVTGDYATVSQVLSGEKKAGRRVVIIGGGATAVETAMFLSAEGAISSDITRFLSLHNAQSPEQLRRLSRRGGRDVTIMSRSGKLGKDIGISTRWSMLQTLKDQGVVHIAAQEVLAVNESGVLIQTPDGKELVECDSVVLALGSKPNLPEWIDERITVIGNALKPAKADDAIRMAYLAAMGHNTKPAII